MQASARVFQTDSRGMPEIEDGSIDLVVTSPPYWHLKDYGAVGQIGYGQTLHEYLRDLYAVWCECFRALRPGSRLCVNIGDQFARAIIYGRYKVIPLHAEVIAQCEQIGLDFLGSIIWQKKTTVNTTGGASIMGSFPYPPNGIVELDYEHILIFKKPGKPRQFSRQVKEASALTTEEWKQFFTGHWTFGGVRQSEHEAMFPEELPRRLIRMFSFVGDTVLDPFLGSGTTARVALELGRSAIGYEINPKFMPVIREKFERNGTVNLFTNTVTFHARKQAAAVPEVNYEPRIKDASPQIDPAVLRFGKHRFYRVVAINGCDELEMDSGLRARLLGVKVRRRHDAEQYLRQFVVGKDVSLEFDEEPVVSPREVEAYVYLKNRIFVNGYLIRSGLAIADRQRQHRLLSRFRKFEEEGLRRGQRVDS